MEEDQEDDMDDGLPPADPRLRVHVDPTGNEPLTPDEIQRFNIKVPERDDRLPAKIGIGEIDGVPTTAAARFAEIMAAKFPSFDPTWPVKLQDRWFAAYERLLKSGIA